MEERMLRYSALEIVSYETGEVVERMPFDPPKPERMADKIDRGAQLNLDHERFYTRLIEAEGEENA